jgi:hemolysin III
MTIENRFRNGISSDAMSAPTASRTPVEEEFSLPLFIVTVVVSMAGICALFWLLAPESLWHTQVNAPWWTFVVAFLAVTVINAFAEFFFHRYVLHKPVLSVLSRFYKQHTLHHSLTRITRRRTSSGRELPYVENIYPITQPEQKEASFFPWYTMAVFAAAITPILVLLSLVAPMFPWFSAGYAALACSLVLYEVFHAIEHWPFEKWAPLVENKYFGWMWRHIYSFHLRHHAVIDCNEAISGFFTFPLPDLVFGTWINPKTLYVDGGGWEPQDFRSPTPYAFIRWCDAACDRIVKARRAKARE